MVLEKTSTVFSLFHNYQPFKKGYSLYSNNLEPSLRIRKIFTKFGLISIGSVGLGKLNMENHDNLLCHFYRGLGQINHNIKLKRNDEIKK